MTPTKGVMTFDHKGIGRVLAEDRLVVPLNQREYSWEDEQIEDLVHDFAAAIDSEKGTHFLGTIVLTTGTGDYPEVTDGQQRLATTMVLLATIRDILTDMGKVDDALSVDRDFLWKYDRSEGENAPRLRLNLDDHAFFEETILLPSNKRRKAKKLERRTKDSHRKLETARRIISKYINDKLNLEKEERKIKVINDWIRFIERNALVIIIKVPEDLDAFIMFETLNDRGLRTSQADLLKNYLFSKVKDRMDEAQQKWSNMGGKLESLGHKNIAVSFIRHLMITMYGPTKERDVLTKVKEKIDKPSQAIRFLDSMAESADDYVAMLNPSHAKWNPYGDETRDHLWTIHSDLDVKQIWPLLFAVTKHFSIKEARAAFRYLVNLSVRFLIVGGRGGLLDRHYALRAQRIGTGEIKTAKELAKSLEDIAPSDEVFELEFSTARVSDSNLARYYLRAIENSANQLPSPEVMPIEDRNKLNLEHILPENPEKKWPGFSDEDAKAYYRRIGNMVLMLSTKNSLIGNDEFKSKRPYLLRSGLSLTKIAGTPSKWGKEEIDARQKELAAMAVKTWPLSVR